jgi:acyl carrier protein
MTDEELIETALTHARAIFKAPELTYNAATVFQHIAGFDSVQAVQFILAMEAACGVLLTEEDVDSMLTMGDMLLIVQKKLRDK